MNPALTRAATLRRRASDIHTQLINSREDLTREAAGKLAVEMREALAEAERIEADAASIKDAK